MGIDINSELKYDFGDDLFVDSPIIEENKVKSNQNQEDFKFYVSYIGLNPFTLLKEDPEFIKFMIRHNLEESRLKFFISNLEDFVSFIMNKASKLSEEDYSLTLSTIISPLSEMVNELNKVLNTFTIKYNELYLSGKYPLNIKDLLSNKSMLDSLAKELEASALASQLNEISYISLESIINAIFNSLESDEERAMSSESNVLIYNYMNRNYTYTEQEITLFEKLGFPTAIMGRESIFKSEVTPLVETKERLISMGRIQQLYNRILSLLLIKDNKKIGDYYR